MGKKLQTDEARKEAAKKKATERGES